MLWGQIKGRMAVYSLLSPRVWGAPETVVHMHVSCRPSPCISCICFVRDLTWAQTLKAITNGLGVLAEMCAEYCRRKGLVESSIWEGSARHSPCLPYASALLHIVLLLYEMDSQTRLEWEVWGPSHGKPELPSYPLNPELWSLLVGFLSSVEKM